MSSVSEECVKEIENALMHIEWVTKNERLPMQTNK